MTDRMSGNTTVVAVQQMSAANRAQAGAALSLQAYCNSVNAQPGVDFSGAPDLKSHQDDINSSLATAQGHANNYLNTIQPAIIRNITNIGNYYALHAGVSAALPPGSSKADWLSALTSLKNQSTAYHTTASSIVDELTSLHDALSNDAASFAETVSILNGAVNGDKGVLASDQKSVEEIQSKIDGAIAAAAVSGLAIAGGGFVIAVGAIAEFVTVGTSTPLVFAGVAIVAAGVAGEVGSAIALNTLSQQKARILREESKLHTEVALAMGLSVGYSSLVSQVKSAVDAATAMKNAWDFLGSDLNSLISDLDTGIADDGMLQKMFLSAADATVRTVVADIATIKAQMTGVISIAAQRGQTVGAAILQAVQAA